VTSCAACGGDEFTPHTQLQFRSVQ
jgi:hypothetical protein